MKTRYKILLLMILGTNTLDSFATDSNQKQAGLLNINRQTALSYGHLAISCTIIGSSLINQSALHAGKRYLFGHIMLCAWTLNFSIGLLDVFFNSKNENNRISSAKAYTCLIGSLAAPAIMATAIYHLPKTLALLQQKLLD